jgi:beta-lactamase regulating signal transducer with metallopeptidase domain/uncharacterized membrane protein YkoI
MQSISQFFLTFLLNAAWQIALVVPAAAVCARLLRAAPARYKYRLWVTALVLSLILPVLTSSRFFTGSIFDRPPPATPVTEKTDPPPAPASFAPAADVETSGPTIPVGTDLAVFLAGAYLLFVFYNAAKLWRAWLRTRRLARSAYSAPLPGCIEASIKKCRAVIGADKADFLFSNALAVPVTIGYLKPLVILPEEFLRETRTDLLVTAIGHELVHVQRRDYLFNLTFTLALLPLSFHPAAMLLKRRIADARELCCDEIVAERLLTAEVYARSLVTIAGSAAGLDRLVPTTSVGIADAGNLEVRIMSLLKKSEISSYKKSFLVAAAVLLLAIPCAVAAVFVPKVGVGAAGLQPMGAKPGPTPPTQEAAAPERTEKLERELKELREKGADIADPAQREARQQKLESELKALQNSERGVEPVRESKERLEKLEVELKALQNNAAGLEDLRERESRLAKIERDLTVLRKNAEGMEEDQRLKEERNQVAERMEKARLAGEARITMEQAVKNALDHQPGKLVEKGISRSQDGEVVYKIFVRDAGGNTNIVIVSGADGRVIKTEKAQ